MLAGLAAVLLMSASPVRAGSLECDAWKQTHPECIGCDDFESGVLICTES